MDLRGKTVLLTGASGGIGSAMLDAFVARGARVVAVGRDLDRLAQIAHRHAHGAVVPFAADLTAADDRAALVAFVGQEQCPPSLLVLAHARDGFGLFAEQDDAELQALLDTNLVAPMRLVRALLPLLQAQPQAAVVAIGSTFGSLAYPGFAAYSAAKFGLRGLMEGLSREHADGHVRFQYLAPRATRTTLNTASVDAMNRELKTAVDEPSDVAALLVAAIERGDRRLQLGWPEKLFARLNGALPALVDRSLAAQLDTIRRHAGADAPHAPSETSHATPIGNIRDIPRDLASR